MAHKSNNVTFKKKFPHQQLVESPDGEPPDVEGSTTLYFRFKICQEGRYSIKCYHAHTHTHTIIVVKGKEETLGSDGCVYDPNCRDGLMDVYLSPTWCYIHVMCAAFYMSIMPQ